MSEAPETIWTWNFLPEKQNDVMKGGWDDAVDKKSIEYRRADLPATDEHAFANEKVKALVQALREIDFEYDPSEHGVNAKTMVEIARAALAGYQTKKGKTMKILTRNHAELTLKVAKHIEADAVIQGEYWDGHKGCFIGCLTHSSNPLLAHERFGLPEPLLRIAESIFERLLTDDAKGFFAELPKAVGRDGKDLSRVHWAFLAAELRALPTVPANIQAAIDPVIEGMETLASGGDWSKDAATAATDAASAAYAAYAAYADYADYAACAARQATDAASAAYAAYAAYADYADYSDYAACAADAAAYAARAADAADDATLRQKNTLLRLISEAK